AARLDGRRDGGAILVQPALVRAHGHDAGRNEGVGLAQSARAGPHRQGRRQDLPLHRDGARLGGHLPASRQGWCLPMVPLAGVPIRNGRGEVTRWFGSATDITERIEAENATRLYADFVKSIPIGVLILRPDDPADDRTLRLLDANPSASRLL